MTRLACCVIEIYPARYTIQYQLTPVILYFITSCLNIVQQVVYTLEAEAVNSHHILQSTDHCNMSGWSSFSVVCSRDVLYGYAVSWSTIVYP